MLIIHSGCRWPSLLFFQAICHLCPSLSIFTLRSPLCHLNYSHPSWSLSCWGGFLMLCHAFVQSLFGFCYVDVQTLLTALSSYTLFFTLCLGVLSLGWTSLCLRLLRGHKNAPYCHTWRKFFLWQACYIRQIRWNECLNKINTVKKNGPKLFHDNVRNWSVTQKWLLWVTAAKGGCIE